ncbi:EAL domain-containing protein [Streptomyces catenulae]|uniref:EAL domain-containing protein n=1 Tax=Streptomyces catenulae TaxID=66875 RepID=A0ABV2Z6C7_9ACTN|nr:EAL domain-containing protein [Streptomyces catenulae]
MPAWTDQLRFAYQPVVNLATGTVVALEVLARPESGDVLAAARRSPGLDAELAALAVRAAARQKVLLPLHLNLYATTVAAGPGPTALSKAVHEAGRRPWEVTLDLGGPFSGLPPTALAEGVARLREEGYRICVDGVGDGDPPLRLLGTLAPDLVKLDASLCAELVSAPGARAAVAAMRQLCAQLGGLLAIEGVETERQYAAVRAAGVQLAQGHLFAPAARRPAAEVHLPPPAPAPVPHHGARPGPPIAQFLQPAALLPVTASAGAVRGHLTAFPDVCGILLVDADGVPVRAVDRDRFLLSLSGRYGHALYADRPALRLADRPRTVRADATAWEVLDLIADGDRSRTGDDVAVVDARGRCVGVVHLADILRALAESRVEEAARLNPLTRLPGSDAVNCEVDRRIAEGRPFALSWLDVDSFKQVNDGAGFAAGDELIRSVGRALAEVAGREPDARVGHIGGDDFLVLAEPGGLEPFAAALLDVGWEAGGAPVTLSLATVVCPPGSVSGHGQAAAALAPLKKAAKALTGASWVVGRPDTDVTERRRGRPAPVPGG